MMEKNGKKPVIFLIILDIIEKVHIRSRIENQKVFRIEENIKEEVFYIIMDFKIVIVIKNNKVDLDGDIIVNHSGKKVV